jgi:cyclopropane fatty-acyl-phospholipid synthase-like methyltransferase
MSRAGTGFDKLAGAYRALEFAAFGSDLERARFAHLERLAGAADILLLGEGDGRCAERLARVAPGARIHCVDSSPGMVSRARRRLARAGAEGRVTFECADLRAFGPAALSLDAVATLFVLDCFEAADVASLVSRVTPAIRPGGTWLFADFVLPERGLARLRARAWLRVLYAFFRSAAGLRVSRLAPSEEILGDAGWRAEASLVLSHGLIRSSALTRRGA